MPLITPQAQHVIDQCPALKGVAQASPFLFLIDAVNFGGQAGRLAGPWAKEYGMVHLEYHKDAKPLSVQLQRLKHSMGSNTLFMPYRVRQHVEHMFPQHKGTSFWWNAQTKQAMSGFDVECGASTDGYELKPDQCMMFFESPQGKMAVAGVLSDEQMQEWQHCLELKFEEARKELEKERPTQEQPYLFFLYGNDDASWSRTFSTKEECVRFLERVHQERFGPLIEPKPRMERRFP